MVDGAPLLPFDPPLLWDVDTGLWAFELGSERDLQHEITSLQLRAQLWATATDYTERLGREFNSLGARSMRMEDICMATGRRVRYETLGPDSWVLTSFWGDHRRLWRQNPCLQRHQEMQIRRTQFSKSQALIC